MALNIADFVEHAIDLVPDRVALICGDEQMTYAQLEERANRLAHYLRRTGRQQGDKVGMYCRNRIEIVEAMVGVFKAGAVMVNINFRYVENELRYIFDNSDMVALMHERRYADKVANVLPKTPKVKTVIVVEDGSRADDFSATAASSSTRRSRRARPSVTSVSAATTTSTCSTPAAPPASPRASCGATRTSGVFSAAAPTS